MAELVDAHDSNSCIFGVWVRVPLSVQISKIFLTLEFRERIYLCNRKRAFSSAGSEHLPYKQGVTGSNPVMPTKGLSFDNPFFYRVIKDVIMKYFL